MECSGKGCSATEGFPHPIIAAGRSTFSLGMVGCCGQAGRSVLCLQMQGQADGQGWSVLCLSVSKKEKDVGAKATLENAPSSLQALGSTGFVPGRELRRV